MTDDVLTINDLEVKKLYLAARQLEVEHGKSLERVLIELAYNDDPAVAVQACRLYFAIMMGSDIPVDDLERETTLAAVVPFRGDSGD